MRLYIDESGYTGENLLDAEQPTFVLASLVISDDAASQLARQVFPHVKAAELKHSSLVKRPQGRQMVLQFLKALRPVSKGAATFIVHKEFCVVAKLVDLWLESAMHEVGYNLYEGGGNIAFSNLTFFVLRSLQSPQFLTKHLRRFQHMMRDRGRRAYDEFWRGLQADLRRCKKQTAEILEHYLQARRVFGYNYLASLPKRTLDIAFAMAVALVGHWRTRTEESIEIIHDASSSMAKEKWLWDALVSPDVPSATVGFDRRTISFPLRIASTEFPDSEEHRQLQFCDLLAGATAEFGRGVMGVSSKPDYCASLEQAGIKEFLAGGVWPAPDVSRTDEGLTGPSPVDPISFFGSLFVKASKDKEIQ
jgi:hypothetical protein